MSGSQDPRSAPSRPAPVRRNPRRLGYLPVVLGGGATVAVVGALGWVLIGAVKEQQIAGSKAPDMTAAEPAAEFLSGEDPSLIRVSNAAPAIAVREAPIDPGRPVESRQPGQLSVEEEARRQAWMAYYQQRATLQDQRHRGRVEAMQGSMVLQRPEQSGGGSPGAPPVPGQGGAGAGPSQRPGTLDQGPATASSLYLATAPVSAVSRYELKRGVSVINFRMTQVISTGAAGQFTALVTKDVMDYETGNHILVPQGSHLIGVYEDTTNPDDERMKAAIVSITYPPTGNPYCQGGQELPLGSMPAGDASGMAGLSDQVDRHTGRRLYNAIIRAIGGSGAAFGAMGYGPSGALMSQMAMQSGNALAGNLRDPGPTFTIRTGFAGTLQLTKSIAFEQPWVRGMGFCNGSPTAPVVQ